MIFFTAIIAVATCVYVVFTIRLWIEIRNTAKSTRDAFRLTLTIQLYQMLGFIMGKGKRRDKIFLNTLKSTFPDEYAHPSSILSYLDRFAVIENNWKDWIFSHDKELHKDKPERAWKHENTKDLTIEISKEHYHPGNYAEFSYQCPKDKEIAWVEFFVSLYYNHGICNGILEYEHLCDPGQWHEKWRYFQSSALDTQKRVEFDEGVSKLRFVLKFIAGVVDKEDWFLRIHKISICLAPKS